MGRQCSQQGFHSRPRKLRSLSAFDNLRHGSVAGLGKHCKINHHGWILCAIAAIVKRFRCCFFATFCCFSATLSTPIAINSYSLSMRSNAQPGYYLIITAATPNPRDITIKTTGITHDSIIFRDITDFIPAINARNTQRIINSKLISFYRLFNIFTISDS